MNYYLEVLKKYAVFDGRSGRAEYWYFVLFNFLIMVGLNILMAMFRRVPGLGMLLSATASIYGLAVLIPGLAVAVRRLHDTNKSGWWILINFIPLIGLIVFLVFMIMDSQPGSNQYGPNPKGKAPAAPSKA